MSVINPFLEASTHAYLQVCKKVQNYYGVKDAEAYYSAVRKSIQDGCKPDEFGIAKHESLLAYCEAAQMERRYKLGFKS